MRKRGIPTALRESCDLDVAQRASAQDQARGEQSADAVSFEHRGTRSGVSVDADTIGAQRVDGDEDQVPRRDAAREQLRLSASAPIFALLPGSRQSELKYMADLFIQTAKIVHASLPHALFLVPLTTRETHEAFEAALYRNDAENLPLAVLFGHAQDAMSAADIVLVASGTATLEAALLGKPMVIIQNAAGELLAAQGKGFALLRPA